MRAVYDELKRTSPPGLRYATFKLDDDVSFVHISESEGERNPLSDVAAFHDFQRGIGERCEVAPVMTELTEIGSFGFFS